MVNRIVREADHSPSALGQAVPVRFRPASRHIEAAVHPSVLDQKDSGSPITAATAALPVRPRTAGVRGRVIRAEQSGEIASRRPNESGDHPVAAHSGFIASSSRSSVKGAAAGVQADRQTKQPVAQLAGTRAAEIVAAGPADLSAPAPPWRYALCGLAGIENASPGSATTGASTVLPTDSRIDMVALQHLLSRRVRSATFGDLN